MFRVGLGQCEGVDTENVVHQVISQCSDQMGDTPVQLGIVFASPSFDHKLMLKIIRTKFPGIEIAGCTTSGVFTSTFGFSDDSIALLVMNTGGIRFRVGLGDKVLADPKGGVEEALASVDYQKEEPAQLGFIFPNGYKTPFDPILQHLNKQLGESCPLFGGIAAHQHTKDAQSYQFYNDNVYTDAMPLVLFYGDISQNFSISHSWRPLGRKALVTRSVGARVYTLDDMTAVDFYRHYLGYHEEPAADFIIAVHPVDEDYFYVRAPNYYHDDGSISFSEPIPEGAKIQLTEAIRKDLTKDTTKSLSKFDFSKQEAPAFALAFSCAFRKDVLGTEVGLEIDMLESHLPKDVPIMGFHSFGEIAPLATGGKSIVHGATLITLLVGPKEATQSSCVKQIKGGGEEALQNNVEFLARRLEFSEQYRRRLELSKELSSRMHSRFMADIERARRELEVQKLKLKKSEEKFRRIVQTTAEGFLLIDENFIIADANSAYCNMLGYRRDEVVGHEHIDFLAPNFAQYILTNKNTLFKQEKRAVEGQLVNKAGKLVPVLIHSNILRDDAGKVIGHMAFVTDMTEQKKALTLAGEVQQSMLPQSPPRIEGIEISGRNISCDEVGGDYFDYFYEEETGDGVVAVVVGDISGHGVDAALLMSSARASLRIHAAQSNCPGKIISGLNKHLIEDVRETNRFMTMLYVKITRDFKSIEWVRAGHEPGILYRAEEDSFEEMVGKGLALGLVQGMDYPVHRTEAPCCGDILVLATDGMWEAMDSRGEMFGKQRLKELIRRNHILSAEEILDACFDGLLDYTAGTQIKDDMTLVIVKITKKS